MRHPLARRGQPVLHVGVRQPGEIVDAEVEARDGLEDILLGAVQEPGAHHPVVGDPK
jgi:hypothetical protein